MILLGPLCPVVAETFKCDVCKKPGIKMARNQKRHAGACARQKAIAFQAKSDAKRRRSA